MLLNRPRLGGHDACWTDAGTTALHRLAPADVSVMAGKRANRLPVRPSSSWQRIVSSYGLTTQVGKSALTLWVVVLALVTMQPPISPPASFAPLLCGAAPIKVPAPSYCW